VTSPSRIELGSGLRRVDPAVESDEILQTGFNRKKRFVSVGVGPDN
jgi:hypothetical protein